MFSSGAQYNKLKTNLRLSINRLKLLEKKKTELTQKSRKEISDYILDHKEDRARIRVEHIIREDYFVEAYELLEMYCDLLLARFGLIQQMKNLDEGIEVAVSSLLWAAPRIQSEIQEFKVISDQLTAKYGKPFAEACRGNQLGKVNEKLMAKLNVHAPPKILVEKYMMEIAKANCVSFTPDPNIMRDDEIAAAEAMLIDFQNQGHGGGNGGIGWMYPSVQSGQPGEGPPGPGGGGIPPPGFNTGGGGVMAMPTIPSIPQQPPAQQQRSAAAFNYPTATQNMPPPQDYQQPMQPPPSYQKSSQSASEIKVPLNGSSSAGASAPLAMPVLPNPPSESFEQDPQPPPQDNDVSGGAGDNLDFDDLSKRFEELKKRK